MCINKNCNSLHKLQWSQNGTMNPNSYLHQNIYVWICTNRLIVLLQQPMYAFNNYVIIRRINEHICWQFDSIVYIIDGHN